MKKMRVALLLFMFLPACLTSAQFGLTKSPEGIPTTVDGDDKADIPTEARPSIGQIDSLPQKIAYPKLRLGQSATKEFVIRNQTSHLLSGEYQISLGFMGDSAAFTIDAKLCDRIEAYGSCTATVTFHPLTLGEKKGHYSGYIRTFGRITNIDTLVEGSATE